jgi:hypothetical protein
MPVHFSAVWKDSGFLASMPPFLVLPLEGIGLVYLTGVRSLNIQQDLKFDRTNLSVTAVNAADITRHLMTYSQNFPAKLRGDILKLASGMLNSLQFGSVLVSVEGSVSGSTASLDYIHKEGQAKMDVFTAKRRKVAVSFRFVRYQDEAGLMAKGTALTPSDAEGLVEIMNRLFLPSANIELTLKSSDYARVNRQLGNAILVENFRNYIVPLRDQGAGLTVFFVGKWKGTTDPLGSAFPDVNCIVVDDSPSEYLAPETAWPPNSLTDDEIYYSEGRLYRPKSDRDLHIVLAHEIAHILGADHNSEQDNLMSEKRQDLKLSKGTIIAIGGK